MCLYFAGITDYRREAGSSQSIFHKPLAQLSKRMMRGRVLADLDPLGVNGRHGRFEVTELAAARCKASPHHRASLAVRGCCGPCSLSLESGERGALTAASSGLDYGSGLKEICHE